VTENRTQKFCSIVAFIDYCQAQSLHLDKNQNF